MSDRDVVSQREGKLVFCPNGLAILLDRCGAGRLGVYARAGRALVRQT